MLKKQKRMQKGRIVDKNLNHLTVDSVYSSEDVLKDFTAAVEAVNFTRC